MLEEIMAVAVARAPRYRPAWMRDEALRSARTCYDHLAGRLGVALAGSLTERGHVLLDDDGGEVTEDGARFLTGLRPRSCRRRRQAPSLLPPLSRLERATAASRRRGRRGAGAALLCARLDRTNQRQPCSRDHPKGATASEPALASEIPTGGDVARPRLIPACAMSSQAKRDAQADSTYGDARCGCNFSRCIVARRHLPHRRSSARYRRYLNDDRQEHRR